MFSRAGAEKFIIDWLSQLGREFERGVPCTGFRPISRLGPKVDQSWLADWLMSPGLGNNRPGGDIISERSNPQGCVGDNSESRESWTQGKPGGAHSACLAWVPCVMAVIISVG